MDTSLANLLGVSAVAFLVPFFLGFFSRLKIPAVVLELIAGMIVGPAVLGWVKPDEVVTLMSTLGVAFLLFLAGMELDLDELKGRPLKLGGYAFLASIAIGFSLLHTLGSAGVILTPSLVTIALASTSVGIVIPVLRDTGQLNSPTGRFTVAGASIAEFGTIAMLAVLFSTGGSPVVEVTLLVVVAVLGLVALRLLLKLAKHSASMKVFLRLDESSSQVRVRLAVMLLLASVVIAHRFGFESILGAFLMGAVLAIVVRTWEHAERFRTKIEAVGFGFFVPVFFVTSGLNFDLSRLSESTELMRIPLFIAILLAMHMLPAMLYRHDLAPRETVAAGLLQATNLSFIVVVANLGTQLGEMKHVTGDALIMAGLFSALVFPAAAQKLLRGTCWAQPQPATAPSDEDL